MDMEEKLTRVRKNCSTIKKFAKVFKVIFIVCFIITILGIMALGFNYNRVNDELGHFMEEYKEQSGDGIKLESSYTFMGMINVSYDEMSTVTNGNYSLRIMIELVSVTILMIAGFVICGRFEKIFANIEKSESPFAEQIINSLKRVFVFTTVITLLTVGLGSAIVVGVFLRFVFSIFEYGAILQTEVDETL